MISRPNLARWFAADHWEKALLAGIVLCVGLVLFRTRWSRPDRQPGELFSAVNVARNQLVGAAWPAEERRRFTVIDYRRRVDRLQTKLTLEDYRYSVPMSWPLIPPRRPVREPPWLPPTHVIVAQSHCIISGKPLAGAPAGTVRHELPLYFVSIRAVVDVERQLRNVLKARHGSAYRTRNDLVKYLDFVIERQEVSPDGRPQGAGRWHRLDIRDAFDVLQAANGLSADPQYDVVRDLVMTMPLPELIFQEWGGLAGHPELSRRAQRLLDPTRGPKVTQPGPKMQGGGFLQLAQGRPARGAMPNAPRVAFPRSVKELEAVRGRLLLFRFIDFTVVPERAYRYRVQLVLENPNYRLRHVADLSVAEGEKRITPFSDPSAIVKLPPVNHIFLEDVTELASLIPPTARIHVAARDDETGTLVEGVIKTPVGGFISGVAETPRLRPSRPSLEIEKVQFVTKLLLVDALASPRLKAADHSELDVGRRPHHRAEPIGIPAVILVADRAGRLIVHDSISTRADRDRVRQEIESERAPFAQRLRRQGAADLDAGIP